MKLIELIMKHYEISQHIVAGRLILVFRFRKKVFDTISTNNKGFSKMIGINRNLIIDIR